MYAIKTLKENKVCLNILSMIYKSLVRSVIMYALIVYFHLLNNNHKNRIFKIEKMANKMRIAKKGEIQSIILNDTKVLASKILNSKDHPLMHYFKYLPHGRLDSSQRRTKRYANSLIIKAIDIINS